MVNRLYVPFCMEYSYSLISIPTFLLPNHISVIYHRIGKPAWALMQINPGIFVGRHGIQFGAIAGLTEWSVVGFRLLSIYTKAWCESTFKRQNYNYCQNTLLKKKREWLI